MNLRVLININEYLDKNLRKLFHKILTIIYWRFRIRFIGARSILACPRLVVGGEFISIDSGSIIEPNGTLYAVKEYSGKTFNPEIRIGSGVYINHSVNLTATTSIVIHDDVSLAYNVSIFDFNHGTGSRLAPIKYQPLNTFSSGVEICRGAWVGANVFISGGVRIGVGAVVGANSVVVSDVPDFAVVSGNPSKVIKFISD